MVAYANQTTWTEWELFVLHIMLSEGKTMIEVAHKLQKRIDEVISVAAVTLYMNPPTIETHTVVQATPVHHNTTSKISDVSRDMLNNKIMQCMVSNKDPFKEIKTHSERQILRQMRRIETEEMSADAENLMLTIATLL
tara:strand:+ start:331 stop:744 length:414 start_codon:yes stop_codon:yes gene_type:complete